MEEYENVCKEGKVALLFGNGLEVVSDTVMEEFGADVLCIG